ATTNDYTASNGTLTFQPGQTNLSVVFTPRDDALIESNETLTVKLTSPSGVALLGTHSNLLVTLLESKAGLAWVSTNATTTEPAAGYTNLLTLTLTRTGNTNGTNSVAWGTADITTQSGTDYIATNGTVTFLPGETNATVDVPILGDGVAEGNERFTVALSNADERAVLRNTNVTVRLLDSDAVFQFIQSTANIPETSNTVMLTVTRSGSTNTTMTVRVSTTNGTAAAGSRYTATNGLVTFAAGVSNRTIGVAILNGTTVDADQTFTVMLSEASTGTVGTVSNCVVTIIDNDARIGWATNVASYYENAGVTTVMVYRTGVTNATNSVVYSFVTGTATTNDYTASNGTLTFQPGETSKPVVFTPADDDLIESNETLTVKLTSPSGVALLGTHSNLLVTLLESKAGLAFASTSVTEPIGPATNWVSVTLTRTGNTNQTNSVSWATVDGTATQGVNYISNSGTLTFDPGMTGTNITIGILDDLQATNKAFSVVLTNASAGTVVVPNATVTIINIDATIRFLSATNSFLESSNAVLSVVRTGPTNTTVWAYYTTVDGSAFAASNDYTAASGTLTFAPGVMTNTLTVSIVNNSVMQGDRAFSVVLTNSSFGATLGALTTNAVNIIDDDSVLYFSVTDQTVFEGSGWVSVLVSRFGYLSNTVSVTIATSNGTAIAGNSGDFNFTNGVMTFGARVTNGTVRVQLMAADGVWNPDRTFYLVLSSPSVNAAASNVAASVTITDVDAPFGLAALKNNARVISSAAPTTQASGTSGAGSATFPAGGEVQTIDIAGQAAVTVRLDGVEIPVGLPDGAEFMTVTVRNGALVLDVTALGANGAPVLWSGELSVFGADVDADGVPDRLATGPLADGTVVLRVQLVDGTLLAETQLPGNLMVVPAAVTFGPWPVEWRLTLAP
ncbi:MAG: Calx-beta domain-containing protein, partial [bacterium]